jgi:hypothetical protein
MYESWTILTANMTYTRSQNYTNIVIGEHRVQDFEVVVVVLLFLLLSFDVFIPTSAHPLIFLTSGLAKYIEVLY